MEKPPMTFEEWFADALPLYRAPCRQAWDAAESGSPFSSWALA
jgi:hypothetical protein